LCIRVGCFLDLDSRQGGKARGACFTAT
jgi:hypothetical protein